ncbi:hypothetical protein [Kitasatospora terrestris]|uniref:hypothetical protein n=1 Tax=Kitasatospora terrestris TaxID=258051 RepID=UPI0031EC9D07
MRTGRPQPAEERSTDDARGGVQVFAVPAATVQEALTLAGDRATAPGEVGRSAHGFRV